MQFARNHPDINVVAIGAGTAANGDSLDGAYTFMSHHGLDTAGMTVIYDASFRAWRNFRVTTQPWVVVYDDAGQLIFSSSGRVDLDSVATALGA